MRRSGARRADLVRQPLPRHHLDPDHQLRSVHLAVLQHRPDPRARRRAERRARAGAAGCWSAAATRSSIRRSSTARRRSATVFAAGPVAASAGRVTPGMPGVAWTEDRADGRRRRACSSVGAWTATSPRSSRRCCRTTATRPGTCVPPIRLVGPAVDDRAPSTTSPTPTTWIRSATRRSAARSGSARECASESGVEAAGGAHAAATDVTFGYGRRSVLRGVSMEVPDGGFVGILGPNGSGKTTLLRCWRARCGRRAAA